MMPKYRSLHTKIIDSFDFNEMPSDFHRVTWMLLPLIVDSAGRGIYNAAWLRSKLYPLREDVSTAQIIDAFFWFVERKMINAYAVEGKDYFYIPSFTTYQSGLDREAKSVLPAPANGKSDSRPTRDLLATKSRSDSEAEADSKAEAEAGGARLPLFNETETDPKRNVTPLPDSSRVVHVLTNAVGLSAFPAKESERIEQLISMMKVHGEARLTEALAEACDRWVNTKSKAGRYYAKVNLGWVDWAQEMLDHGTGDNGRGMTRQQWDSMNQEERTKHIMAGLEVPTK